MSLATSIRRRKTLGGLLFALFVCATAAVWMVWNHWGNDRQSNRIGSSGSSVSLSRFTSQRSPGENGEQARPKDEFDLKRDDWNTEVFSDAALKQLKVIGRLLEHPSGEDSRGRIGGLTVEKFSCGPLRPEPLKPAFADRCLEVLRTDAAGGTELRPVALKLAEALDLLRAPYGDAADVRVKFKIFRVDVENESATTAAYYQAAGRFSGGVVQQSAVWHCTWNVLPGGSLPRLVSIHVSDYEEITNTAGHEKWFADCTAAVLSRNQSYNEQLLYGIDHWRARMPLTLAPAVTGQFGVAVGDVNGDGLDDLYVCQSRGVPNRLFIQNEDGTATDISVEAGVDWMDNTYSALILDLDNDGDQDLVVATSKGLLLLANDGRGRFAPASPLTGRRPTQSPPTSLAAADYDNDGDLDIYVCVYSPSLSAMNAVSGGSQNNSQEKAIVPTPFHDANNGGPNVLFRNEGELRFVDVTSDTGLNIVNHRYSLAAAWCDYDNDGDLDLYVANDYGRNNLFRNDAGQFVDVAAEAGVEDIAAGMSVSWGDYNNDGLPDLYVSNMFSSAGNRIAYQRKFKSDSNEETRTQYQRHARGNTLFENVGDGTFRDVSVSSAVTMGRWAWGSTFIDLNNDGLEDILVANGYVTQEDTGDL